MQRVSNSSKVTAKPGDLVVFNPGTGWTPILVVLQNKMRELAVQLQEGTSLSLSTLPGQTLHEISR